MAITRPPPSLILATLDRETAEHHANANADLFTVLDDPTVSGYQRFLSAVFQFEYAVEDQLARNEALPIQFVAARLKTGRLGDDLLALGLPYTANPLFNRPVHVPRFRDGYDALAWIYVLQHNTLRHMQLYRVLAPRLRTVLQSASRYLTTHASDVYQRWHELGDYLDRVVCTPDKVQQLVEVARDAFRIQHSWYAAALGPQAPARPVQPLVQRRSA
jgi:heme oxygenase